MRIWVILGALNGFLAVGLGAVGAHAVKGTEEMKETFMSANRYHMYHALALILIGLLAERLSPTPTLVAGSAIALGMVLFCLPVYVLGISGNRLAPFPIAPVGGVLMMVGWLALAVAAFMGR